jgi:2-oxoglutarate ferredoxin oxidoreductase subunit gamma
MVKPGGTILVNADMMTADTNVRDDIRVVSIHCNELAEQVKNPKGANIVMIGVITKLLGDFSHDEGRDGMNDMFRKKGKSKFEEKNVAAFEAGYNAI